MMACSVQSADNLRVLMIGNSFSVCVGRFMPDIVKSVPGKNLELTSLYIGGCTLDRHWNNVVEGEKNKAFAPYIVTHWNSEKGYLKRYNGNIHGEIGKGWDVISIQQGSPASWDLKTYQPYVENLVKYIRANAPGAEIVIQQTWAYRNSDLRIAPGSTTWGFDQQGMYDRLTAAYTTIAKQYGFRIIPTGLAVQLSRAGNNTVYANASNWDKLNLKWPDLPPWSGDVVGKIWWTKNNEGKLVLTADNIHLNVRGEYLQACVWFAKLYGVNTDQIKFVPKSIDDEDAAFLRKVAQEAVDKGL